MSFYNFLNALHRLFVTLCSARKARSTNKGWENIKVNCLEVPSHDARVVCVIFHMLTFLNFCTELCIATYIISVTVMREKMNRNSYRNYARCRVLCTTL